ncbi:MAG: helix-turn-helix domain-containing protein [Oscillospiraceae bacterium]|jgi:transcriptional regulator with XRE-family HTH domain
MFQNRFMQLLQLRNITAYKLSKDTGITQGMISYWKNGERMPSADNLIVLADYFDCSVDYLLGRTDNPDVNR